MTETTPFLGSKISLVSKAEIRYDGILYAVDTKESTVTLSKVRSFGTEDRPATKHIPPRNDVYEYIIFRGSDIKELAVEELTGQGGPHQDPAILSASSVMPVNSLSPHPLTHMPVRQPQSSSLLGMPGPAPTGRQPPPHMIPPQGHPGQGFTPFPPAGTFTPAGNFSPFGHYFRARMPMSTGPIPPQQISPPQVIKPKDLMTTLPAPPGLANTSTPISAVSNVSRICTSPISVPELGLSTQTSSCTTVTQTTSMSTPVTLSQAAVSIGGTRSQGSGTSAAVPQGSGTSAASLAKMPGPLLQPGPQNSKTNTGSQSVVSAQQGQPSSSASGILVSNQSTQTQPMPRSEEPKPLVTSATSSTEVSGKRPSSLQSSSGPSRDKSKQQRQPNTGRRGGRGGRERDQYRPRDVQYQDWRYWPQQQDRGYYPRDNRYQPRGRRGGFRERQGRGGYSVKSRDGEPNSSGGGGAGKQTFRYDSDFDFETANARFNRDQLEKEMKKMKVDDEERSAPDPDVNGEPQSPDAIIVEDEEGDEQMDGAGNHTTLYSKDDFFDSISCESKQMSLNKRPNRSVERAINTETFGTYSRGYRGQGWYPYNRGGRYGRSSGGYQNYRYDNYDQRRGGYGGYQKQNWSGEGRGGRSGRTYGSKSSQQSREQQSREQQQPPPKPATTEAAPVQ